MVDLYCERIGPELWAEPINALTNLAFFISAYAIWQLATRLHKLSLGVWILIILIVTIGIGSGLFHTFTTTWARWLDIIPILLFQLVYLWQYADKIIKINRNSTAGLLVLYVIAAYVGRQFPHILNGSLIYAPAFLMLVGLSFYHYLNRKKERFILLVSLGVLMLSLLFRSIDTTICTYLPIGTHFLWHLFNGLLTYMVVRGLLMNVLISTGEAYKKDQEKIDQIEKEKNDADPVTYIIIGLCVLSVIMIIFISWAYIFIIDNITYKLIGYSFILSLFICYLLSSIKYTLDDDDKITFSVPEGCQDYIIGLPCPYVVIQEGIDYVGNGIIVNWVFSFLLSLTIFILIFIIF